MIVWNYKGILHPYGAFLRCSCRLVKDLPKELLLLGDKRCANDFPVVSHINAAVCKRWLRPYDRAARILVRRVQKVGARQLAITAWSHVRDDQIPALVEQEIVLFGFDDKRVGPARLAVISGGRVEGFP